MSAIYGMVRFDGAPVTGDMLAPMGAALSSWGPDGHGQWCGESAGLGHLMLHVTPESLHERLPVSLSAAPHMVITADARIDNRDELFDALSVPDRGRDKTPDSSLILLAYERWGADCVKRLLGDFAFAIWDGRKRTLFCARDPFGCRPFLYHSGGKRFIFASGIKAVLARVESPKLNEPLIAAYLQFKTYHAEKRYTFFEEIVKLPPAHSLLVSASGLQLSRYWSAGDAPEIRLASDAEYTEQMRTLFEESVRCRLRAAFPVGSHLSGGLDSSAISIQAARILHSQGKPLAVFSWSPPPDPDATADPESEHLRIEAVCKQEGLVCQYIPPTKESFIEAFRKDVSIEPVEMMPWESGVQSAARAQGLRVILSGWGGDEAVSTRLGEGKSIFSAFRRHLPDAVYALLVRGAFLEHRSPCIQPAFAERTRREVADLRGPVWRVHSSRRTTMNRRLDYGHLTRRAEHWCTSGAPKRLEYRYPMLDRRLVEFALGIPEGQFWRRKTERRFFMKAIFALAPPNAGWDLAKSSPGTLQTFRYCCLAAHSDISEELLSNLSGRRSAAYVDEHKLRHISRGQIPLPQAFNLSGLKEAFWCLALNSE